MKWVALAAVVAAGVSACGGDDHGSGTAPPVVSVPEVYFSQFAEQNFATPANGTPANFDGISLIYDVNEDPSAFNALLGM